MSISIDFGTFESQYKLYAILVVFEKHIRIDISRPKSIFSQNIEYIQCISKVGEMCYFDIQITDILDLDHHPH